MEVSGIKEIYLKGKAYPRLLGEISDAPKKLYVKGEIKPEDELALAVVGTRKCTPYGLELVTRLVPDLAAAGLTIVSGLAMGIDAAAHRAALEGGGRTIAVLGTGVNIVYPSENAALARQITGRGALVSEYEPDAPSAYWTFPRRNRIISGLSLGVLVVEAPEESGALITARLALDQGREVFAAPGSVFSEASAGCLELIKNGAKLVRAASDVLEELRLEDRSAKLEARKVLPQTAEEGKLLALLRGGPQNVDFLVKESRLAAPVVLSVLGTMEIRGLVRRMGGQEYMAIS